MDSEDLTEPLAVVRSEEELRAGTEAVEAGSVRVRKHVETHTEQLPVTLAREILEVSSERVGAPVGRHDFREVSVEIPLHAQRPRVRTHAVAKERVRVDREAHVERVTVQDEVRRERVRVEGEIEGGGR